MLFDVAKLQDGIAYKLLTSTIVPRPIGWISTVSAAGMVNLAPYSFFNAMGGNPPVVAVGMLRAADRGLKDSARNILETREFVVNVVTEVLARQMNDTCAAVPPGVDEMAMVGLTPAASTHVAAPRVAQSPVALECKVRTVLETGPDQVLVVGEVVAFHIVEDCVIEADKGYIDTPALGLIARMHGAGWYARSHDLFQLARPAAGDQAK